MKLVQFFGAVAVLISSVASSLAASVTLAWDPVNDPQVTGYKIYCGVASRAYTNVVSVGKVTSASVGNLIPAVRYYFAATAVDSTGLESEMSNEVSYDVPVSTPSTIALSNLQQIYDGNPKRPLVTTVPSGLAVQLTYNGKTNTPVAAGSYALVATITDPIYQRSVTNTFVINKAAATVVLSGLSCTYDGSGKAASVVTAPGSLPLRVTYNGSTSRPVNAGTYTVTATVTCSNHTGQATGNLVISRAQAIILLSQLSQAYDGQPKPVQARTVPAGLPVRLSYGSGTQPPSTTPPTLIGRYSVIAITDHTNYVGATAGVLVISSPSNSPVMLELSWSPKTPTSKETLARNTDTSRLPALIEAQAPITIYQSSNLTDWIVVTNVPAAASPVILTLTSPAQFFYAKPDNTSEAIPLRIRGL